MLTISADAAMAAVNSHFLAPTVTPAELIEWYAEGLMAPFSGDELARCKNERCH